LPAGGGTSERRYDVSASASSVVGFFPMVVPAANANMRGFDTYPSQPSGSVASSQNKGRATDHTSKGPVRHTLPSVRPSRWHELHAWFAPYESPAPVKVPCPSATSKGRGSPA
jgi:hypothetical protein